jgi:hypothetical protein
MTVDADANPKIGVVDVLGDVSVVLEKITE